MTVRRYRTEATHRWHHVPLRAGDVVVSTRSKCGTTLLQRILVSLTRDSIDLPAPLAELSPWIDWEAEPVEAVRARLDAQPGRRVVKTHTPLDGLDLRADVTYVVVARHPLDVAESLYHHARNIDRARFAHLTGRAEARSRAQDEPLERWVQHWLDETADPADDLDTLPGLTHHLADAWARRDRPDVVLVRFEDVVADRAAAIRSIADRLGLTPTAALVAGLAEATAFDAMRAAAATTAPDHLGVLADPTAFFRAGRPGSGGEVLGERVRRRAAEVVTAAAPPDLVAWWCPDLGPTDCESAEGGR